MPNLLIDIYIINYFGIKYNTLSETHTRKVVFNTMCSIQNERLVLQVMILNHMTIYSRAFKLCKILSRNGKVNVNG